MTTLIESSIELLTDSFIKSSVLVLVAMALICLMKRASASYRHAILATGIVAALLLPILTLALPHWRLLPARSVENSVTVLAVQPLGPAGAVEDAGGSKQQRSSDVGEPSVLRTSTAAIAGDVKGDSPPTSEFLSRLVSWPIVVLSCYFIVALAMLGRILVAFISLQRRSSKRLATNGFSRELALAAAKVGVHRKVQVEVSPDRIMAMTWGVSRPRIVLPIDAKEWTATQMQCVLMHELAHVKRWDALWDLLAQFARAVYWFNPLMWMACRQMKLQRERACDDLVVTNGARETDYAECLMEFADAYRPYWAGVATMANSSRLHSRLLAILEQRSSRRPITSWATVLLVILVTCLAIPLAMLTSAEARQPTDDQPVVPRVEPPAAVAPAEVAPAAPVAVVKAAAGQADDKNEIAGVVVDHNGKPVAAARVTARGKGTKPKVVATNQSGEFLLTQGKKKFTHLEVRCKQLRLWAVKVNDKRKLNIRLPKPATLTVKFDIPGANHPGEFRLALNSKSPRIEPVGKKSVIMLHLQVSHNKDWKGAVLEREFKVLVKNPGEVTVTGLTPGVYDFSRPKLMKLGNFSAGGFLNRRKITLKAAETKTISLVVKKGKRIQGRVLGVPSGAKGVMVLIRTPGASAKPGVRDDWKKVTYDGIGTKIDGKFKTALLKPGKYKVIAHVYVPDPSARFRSGFPVPSYIGSTTIVVTKTKEPQNVEVVLKPRSKKK